MNLFFTKEVPCFTLQDIFISGEVLVLAFLSHLSNLWLDICHSFVSAGDALGRERLVTPMSSFLAGCSGCK